MKANETRTQYRIMGSSPGTPAEELDTAESSEEASHMVRNYTIAFGNWRVWSEPLAGPNPPHTPKRQRSDDELLNLAQRLTFKADIYGPRGRIYGFQAPFKVWNGKLFHGITELDPDTLYDGHGRAIV